MEATPVIARIFTPHEATQLFSHLDQIEIEYHKPYLRFNKPVKVPRGQASFTLYFQLGRLPPTLIYLRQLLSRAAAQPAPAARRLHDVLRLDGARLRNRVSDALLLHLADGRR